MAQLSAKNSQTAYDWPERLTQAAAAQIRRYRQARSMSTQDLADRCAELGMPIKRSVLANLETRRRSVLTLAELFVIAAALDVPPIELALPLARQADIEILPGVRMETWQAGQWFRGDGSLRQGREGIAFEARPEEPDIGRPFRGLPVDWLARHEALVRQCSRIWDALVRVTAAIERQFSAAEAAEVAGRLELSLDMHERQLAEHRLRMYEQGLVLPRLPADLRHIEDVDASPEAGE